MPIEIYPMMNAIPIWTDTHPAADQTPGRIASLFKTHLHAGVVRYETQQPISRLNSEQKIVVGNTIVNFALGLLSGALNLITRYANPANPHPELLDALQEIRSSAEGAFQAIQSQYFDSVSDERLRGVRRQSNQRIDQLLCSLTLPALYERYCLTSLFTSISLEDLMALFQQAAAKPQPTTHTDYLNRMPLVMVDNSNCDTCAVCLEDFQAGDLVHRLPCGHVFCAGEAGVEDVCSGVRTWLQDNHTCPTCRYELPTQPDSLNTLTQPQQQPHTPHQPQSPQPQQPRSHQPQPPQPQHQPQSSQPQQTFEGDVSITAPTTATTATTATRADGFEANGLSDATEMDTEGPCDALKRSHEEWCATDERNNAKRFRE